MEAIEALTTRVSAGPLVDPAPDEIELYTMLAAAVRAPDHGMLRPWRFTALRGTARERLGELMVQTYKRRHPDAAAAQLDKERTKPLRAPLVVVVGAKVDEKSKIPVIEQVLAAGAAAQNLMVSAYALGFGCAWKTGEAAYDPEVKAAFGLEAKDSIVAFLYLGTNAAPLPPPPQVEVSLAEWPDDGSG